MEFILFRNAIYESVSKNHKTNCGHTKKRVKRIRLPNFHSDSTNADGNQSIIVYHKCLHVILRKYKMLPPLNCLSEPAYGKLLEPRTDQRTPTDRLVN